MKKKPTAKKASAKPPAKKKAAAKPHGAPTKTKKAPQKKVRAAKEAARKAPVRPAPKLSPAKAKELRAAKAARRRKVKALRKVLIEKHQGLVRTYVNIKGDTRNTTSDGTEDYIDYAVSSYDRDFTLSLTEMERKQIRMVEDALRRIDRGEYGNCEQCGVEIPERRLEVEPWARHCIRCQELEEQGLLQQRTDELDYDDDVIEVPDDDTGDAKDDGFEEAAEDDAEPADDDDAGDDDEDSDEDELNG